MIATGGAALRSIGSASEPSVSIRTSLTILMTIWPGVTDFTTSAPTRAGAGLVDEGAHHVQRHVGFEQSAAHFAHGRVDVLFAEGAAPGQAVEYAGELFGKALEHRKIPLLPRKLPPSLVENEPAKQNAPGGASRCRTWPSRVPRGSAKLVSSRSREAGLLPLVRQ